MPAHPGVFQPAFEQISPSNPHHHKTGFPTRGFCQCCWKLDRIRPFECHSRIRSTSLSVISSFVRSYSLVVRGDSCPAICWACSSRPSFNFNGDDRRFVLCSLSDAAPKPRCHRELAACRGMLCLIRTFVLEQYVLDSIRKAAHRHQGPNHGEVAGGVKWRWSTKSRG